LILTYRQNEQKFGDDRFVYQCLTSLNSQILLCDFNYMDVSGLDFFIAKKM